MGGFLEGVPKVLTNLSFEFLKKTYGYFTRIKITKLHKHLDVPLTSKNDKDGARNFTHIMVNGIIDIGKTGLEDLIKFQNTGFDITDGYCF